MTGNGVGTGVLMVTGGSRGIGAAIARRAAQAGWSVGIVFREQAAAAEQIVAAITQAGGQAVAVQSDVTDEAGIVRAFDTIQQAFGPVTGLVNNAGISAGETPFTDVTRMQILNVLRTNVLGTMLCSREAVRRMSTARGGPGGAIVNISSGSARTGSPGTLVHYATTKGAIDSFTLGLAREVAKEGIRVNAVRAGPTTDTGMITGGGAMLAAALSKKIPLGRLAAPDEIATAVLWLLDPAGTFVTGALLDATGGL